MCVSTYITSTNPHLLDVSSFRDSTAKWSEPKNKSLQGGPPSEDLCGRPAALLLRTEWTQQDRMTSRAAPAALPVVLMVSSERYTDQEVTIYPRRLVDNFKVYNERSKTTESDTVPGAAMFSVTLLFFLLRLFYGGLQPLFLHAHRHLLDRSMKRVFWLI